LLAYTNNNEYLLAEHEHKYKLGVVIDLNIKAVELEDAEYPKLVVLEM